MWAALQLLLPGGVCISGRVGRVQVCHGVGVMGRGFV